MHHGFFIDFSFLIGQQGKASDRRSLWQQARALSLSVTFSLFVCLFVLLSYCCRMHFMPLFILFCYAFSCRKSNSHLFQLPQQTCKKRRVEIAKIRANSSQVASHAINQQQVSKTNPATTHPTSYSCTPQC